ncbi:hypothetical protein [Anaerococcus vaginalis]|uniref:hypothetical protein n=1 Tax=Anaerococcus vaginalis TaxID=33037 RepID=UPI0029027CAC|nr:hypothetical protein [Anaerococcus vaginalis]MDU2376156.1 hypothetical protein [Anaerococcus vaginalis]
MKIYDDYNNYTYAKGNTEEELIKNWNEKAEENFSWILEDLGNFNEKEDENIKKFFEECIQKQESLTGIEFIIKEINKIEVNNIKVYK